MQLNKGGSKLVTTAFLIEAYLSFMWCSNCKYLF